MRNQLVSLIISSNIFLDCKKEVDIFLQYPAKPFLR